MGQKSAVVIDDEPDITTYLSMLLADQGWRVRAANTAAQGLKLVQAERPDVLLLDLMMPEQGGLSVLVTVRKDADLRDLPVVLVSGIQEKLTSDYHAYLERFRHYRPDAFVDKPIDPAALVATLEKVTAART